MSVIDPEPSYRSVVFPLYGLPRSWQGSRWVGGWGGPNIHAPDWDPPHPGPSTFTLAHGGPWDSPVLRVSAFHEMAWPPNEIASSFASELGLLDPTPPPNYTGEWYDDLERRAEALDWEVVDILVDEAPVPFNLLRRGGGWEAWSQSDQVRVTLDGRGSGGFPLKEVELVTVLDATEYIEGTRANWRKQV